MTREGGDVDRGHDQLGVPADDCNSRAGLLLEARGETETQVSLVLCHQTLVIGLNNSVISGAWVRNGTRWQ